MFDATIDNIHSNRVMRYRLMRDAMPLSFSDVLDLWQTDADFRNYYTNLLADSPFAAYRWETPALTAENASQPFQFVLLNAPGFSSRQTDPNTYDRYFTNDDTDYGVVSFANLGRDATLVVPSPRTEMSAYGHLAAFIRHAPKKQVNAFWRIIGKTVRSVISQTPLWLSTAGGGVAWLHVRLDSRPKYYGYSPYKTA
ncbi:MAG: hypothetical protein AAFN77_11925 [Planctomycetota bacterium]